MATLPYIKIVMFFQSQYGHGWTETHYYNPQSPSNVDFDSVSALFLKNVVGNRAACLGSDCSVIGYRLSQRVAGGIASKPYELNPQQSGPEPEFSSSSSDSLAIYVQDASHTRHKILHLRGFWNAVIIAEEYNPATPTGNAFKLNLNQYFRGMTNIGLGWLGKLPATSCYGLVNSYVINANGTITFSVTPGFGSAALATLDQTQIYECQISKLNRSDSVLNRSLVLLVTSAAPPYTLTTVQPIACGPFSSAGKFNITQPTFIAYDSFPSIKIGERRMGKALGLLPGRGKRRPVR